MSCEDALARLVRALARILPTAALVAALAPAASAQTVDDGVMVGKQNLFVGNMYSHDTWDEYWEGTLKRTNGNIGKLTTRTDVWFAAYGVTDRLNVLATVPHVWTKASQGVLAGMRGLQDLSLSAKFRLVNKPSTSIGALSAIAVGSAGLPMTDYTPDYYPLSLGSGSKRVSGRFTLNVRPTEHWSFTGSSAYTWRAQVTLDRPYYYTDGQLFFTDQVDLPNVFDYTATAGYTWRGVMSSAFFSQQRTLGGGDIRRQDMPFVSNRMDFQRIGGRVMTPLPKLPNLMFEFGYAYTLGGRNVGQSTTITTGLQYKLPFLGSAR